MERVYGEQVEAGPVPRLALHSLQQLPSTSWGIDNMRCRDLSGENERDQSG